MLLNKLQAFLCIKKLNSQHMQSVLALKQAAISEKGTAYYHPEHSILLNSLASNFSLGLFSQSKTLEGILTVVPESCYADLESLLPPFTHSAYVSGLYVNPQYRQQGYAHKMFTLLHELLAKSTVDLCWTTIDPTNHASLQLFQQNDFNILVKLNAYKTNIERYLMYKYL